MERAGRGGPATVGRGRRGTWQATLSPALNIPGIVHVSRVPVATGCLVSHEVKMEQKEGRK